VKVVQLCSAKPITFLGLALVKNLKQDIAHLTTPKIVLEGSQCTGLVDGRFYFHPKCKNLIFPDR